MDERWGGDYAKEANAVSSGEKHRPGATGFSGAKVLAGLGAVLLGLMIGVIGMISGGSAAGANTRAPADYGMVNSAPEASSVPSTHSGLFDGAGLDLHPLVLAGVALILVGGLVLLRRSPALPLDDAGTGGALRPQGTWR